MGKSRMMGAGLASSSLYKTNTNLNTSGGSKKQGLPAFDGLIANRTLVVTKAEGRNRNVVFTLNQMGGVSSSSFSSSAHVYAVGGGVHKPPKAKQFKTSLVAGLADVTKMAFAPDGRLFVLQKTGQVRIVENGILLPTPFLTLAVDTQGDRGLLGIAFDPDFVTTSRVYLYYTRTVPTIHDAVAYFTAVGNVANPTPHFVWQNATLGSIYHDAGALAFHPDGTLFIGVGDDSVGANSQNLSNFWGKVLRINKDGTYPTGNISPGSAVWAYGFRNPWSIAINKEGRVLINDVGQITYEEINEGAVGGNYGWPNCEGPSCSGNPLYVSPVAYYAHGPANVFGCAIVGATFYENCVQQFPAPLKGCFFFADYCKGYIHYLDRSNIIRSFSEGFSAGLGAIVDVCVAPDGSLYYLNDTGVHSIQYS